MTSNFLVVQLGRCRLRFLGWGKERWGGCGGWKLYVPPERMSFEISDISVQMSHGICLREFEA